jgi:hypothetical protein
MRLRNLIISSTLALSAAGSAHALPADKLYSLLSPSVWTVLVGDEGKPFGQGSAVVVGPETLLTNCHVVLKAARIEVHQEKRHFWARLQYIDPERDMCQITARGMDAPAVAIGDSDKVGVGQKIYTLGNPQGMELTLSDGLVSALRRDDKRGLYFIQISAPISHGSSGGGLFDEDGKLIGITSAGIDKAQNVNFVIPIKWMNELPERSKVAMPRYQMELAAEASKPKVPPPSDKPATDTGTASAGTQTKPRPQKTHETPARAMPPSVQDAGFTAEAARAAAFPRIVPVASGYADLNDIDKVLAINPRAKKSYQSFLTRPLPRAFALAEYGGTWSSFGTYNKTKPLRHPDPAVRVVPDCEQHYGRRCHLYAVDETVVWKPTDQPMTKPTDEANE